MGWLLRCSSERGCGEWMMQKIEIDPITRLEGHGRICIFLDQLGDVADAYFQVPELRGFEKFCEGRPVEELPRIVTRICGVCPEAHHMASAKAVDAVFHVTPTPTGKKLRELFYSAFFATDHATHFYILAGADFLVGPQAPAAERNVFGAIAKVGEEIGKRIIRHRMECKEVIDIIGARQVHPVCALPGGVSKPLAEKDRERVEQVARDAVKFGELSLQLFGDLVLANPAYRDLIFGETYRQQTYYMGTVDEHNHVNFYDGEIRVVSPEGKEFARFRPAEYTEHLAERVEAWSYLKFPYLKGVGWKGLDEGSESGIYQATPLSRLNVADGMATPLAQAAYHQLYDTLGGKPAHLTLATHWARLVEMLYAAERMLQLAQDPEITDKEVRVIPTQTPDEGVGVVEAPRGTLYHHYQTDKKGIVQKVNLIVGTTNNHGAICMSIRRAAQGLISAKRPPDPGVLNMVEMAFRAYDPCFACATHFLPGEMPMELCVYSAQGELLHRLTR